MARRAIVLFLAGWLSGCSLLFDSVVSFRCDGPDQCPEDTRCYEGRCQGGRHCGDYVVDANEDCDDGGENGDPNKCDTICSGITPAVCDNGILEAGELCENALEPARCTTGCSRAKPLQVVAGRNHTCSLWSTGRVQCWGENVYRD